MHLGYGSRSTAPVMCYTSLCFNPRPTSWLGATFDLLWLAHCRPCFNPRSTSWLGAATGNKQRIRMGVCFNPHPTLGWGAAGTLSLVWTKGVVVSILIPLGWARVAVTIALLCFNSHSTSSAGCNSVRSSFNPRPAYWLGAGGGSYNPGVFQSSPNLSVGCRWRYSLFSVSILAQPLWLGAAGRIVVFGRGQGFQSSTQPLGWVQVAVILPLLCFNPHPISRLGAAPNALLPVGYRHLFQSSPNLSVGCSSSTWFFYLLMVNL